MSGRAAGGGTAPRRAPRGGHAVLQGPPHTGGSASRPWRAGLAARACLAAGVLGGALLLAGACSRASPESWAYELTHQLMSPFCPGRTLPDCPSPQAAQLQQWIREQERIGRSRNDVETELVTQFGDVILQSPRASGFGLAAYVIPVVLILSGGSLLVYFLRRETRAPKPASPPAAGLRPVDPELERLLDAELRASDPER